MKIEKKVKKHRTWKCNYFVIMFLRIKAHNALAFPFFYTEMKFGPLEEGIKSDWHQLRLKFFRRTVDTPCLITKGVKKFRKR